jgi:hypothetical protein
VKRPATIRFSPAPILRFGKRLVLLAPLALVAVLLSSAVPSPAGAQFSPARLVVTVGATPGTVSAGQPVTISYSVYDPNAGQQLTGIVIDFGDGSSQQAPTVPPSGTVVHTYSNPRLYVVTVSASDSGMAAGQGTTTVTVGKGVLPAVAGCSWTGLWDTGLYGQLNLVQSGSSVSGTYAFYPNPGAPLVQGQISATVLGTTLSGTWAQSPTYTGQDAGAFSFTLVSGCNQFSGQWRVTTTPAGLWDGSWNGTRMQ